MNHIKVNKVSKIFEDFRAVNQAEIDIQEGEFFTLLGPSGCGKTTLLRILAGFYQQEEGNIYFGDQLMDNIPAYKRNIGMVFQNYAIFPHMSVFDNIAYGLKARKVKKKEIQNRVNEALEMVELLHLKDREPSNLSGGQQQRVALARAIVIHPGLLLMDEPLSNLDAKLRVKMRYDIKNLQKELNITTIYVTHDQEEALAVSDRIAVLNDGIIQQIGKPHEIYLSPKNKFVANFIGTTNFIQGECKSFNQATNTGKVMIGSSTIDIPLEKRYEGEVIYSIRPEQLSLTQGAKENSPQLNGQIVDAIFLGEIVEYKVLLETKQTITVHEHAITHHQLRQQNENVRVNLNPTNAIIFNHDGEEALNINETGEKITQSII